jgi:DNA-directed RNA polymerase specialized sigma24 family protein
MPVDVRVPLLLRRVEGLALEEIAARTGKSLATVKRRIADGERALTEGPRGERGERGERNEPSARNEP